MVAGALLQSKQANTGGTTGAITFDTTPTEGSLLVAHLRQLDTRTVTPPEGWLLSVSDFAEAVAGVWMYQYYKIAEADEPDPATYEWTWVTNLNTTLHVMEREGPFLAQASVLGVTAKADSAGVHVSSQSTGTTATTAQADALAVAGVGSRAAGATTSTSWTNSFLEDLFTPTGLRVLGSASKLLTATGTVETTWTCSQSNDMTGVVGVYQLDVATPATSLIVPRRNLHLIGR